MVTAHSDRGTRLKRKQQAREDAKEARDFEAEQRNATLASKLLKSNTNNDPLWNSGPRPPLIWRVGAGVLGFFFLFAGACFLGLGLEDHESALFLVSLLCFVISVRPIWNAIKPRKIDPS